MTDSLPTLTFEECRVLGVLIEKALSTPEYYPLTVNQLVAGCNQKSNRDPVVDYGEAEAMAALDALMRKRLVAEQTGMGSRVAKYRTLFGGVFDLGEAQKALMGELLLRGPQTAGELRARTARMHAFDGLDAVQAELAALAEREPPLVAEIPPPPGRREPTYAHTLAPLPEPVADDDAPTAAGQRSLAGTLADEVDRLKSRLDALEEAFAAFRRQFE